MECQFYSFFGGRALLACGVNSDEQSLKTAIVQNASYKNLVEQFQRVMNAQVLMRMLFESPKPNWTAISGALQGSATRYLLSAGLRVD